jgi:hypothetical protein
MKNVILLLILSSFIATTGCKKGSQASDVPAISLVSVFPDSLRSGAFQDTVTIRFSLLDGDADLGVEQNQNQKYDIYIKDARVDTFTGYFFPEIAEFIKNPKKGIQGTCTYLVLGSFTYTREDSIHANFGDTTQFELYIKDVAGNESNHITTGPVYIRPI